MPFFFQRSRGITTTYQARSQDLEKGGAILKEWEVCKRPWLEFSLTLNQFEMVCQNLRRNVSKSSKIQPFFPPKIRWSPKKKVFAKIQSDFSAEIQNSNVFSAQNQVISKKKKKKKKKGLRQNSEWFFGRNSKFKHFFRPKSSDLQKKKKKKQFKAIFLPKFCKFKRFRGALYAWGGAIFNFSQKIGLKSTKNMRFCILHKPMGGARAPPAPLLATLLLRIICMTNWEIWATWKQKNCWSPFVWIYFDKFWARNPKTNAWTLNVFVGFFLYLEFLELLLLQPKKSRSKKKRKAGWTNTALSTASG